MTQASDLASRIEALPALVNDDAWLVHRGRHVTVEFRLDLGALAYQLAIERGRIAAVMAGRHLMRSWRFAIRGDEAGWLRFWEPVPAPGWHDVFALSKLHGFAIEGDLQPLMANLFYFKDVLAAPRRLARQER